MITFLKKFVVIFIITSLLVVNLVTTLNTKKAQATSGNIGSFPGAEAEAEALGLEGPEAEGGIGLWDFIGAGIKTILEPVPGASELGGLITKATSGFLGETGSSILGSVSQYAIQSIAESARRNIINKLYVEMINWVEGEGWQMDNQDWEKMGGKAADDALGLFLDKLAGEDVDLCNPYQETGLSTSAALKLILKKPPTIDKGFSCSAKEIEKALTEQGFEGLVDLSTSTSLNPYNMALYSLETKGALADQLEKMNVNRAISGQGYLGQEKAKKWRVLNKKTNQYVNLTNEDCSKRDYSCQARREGKTDYCTCTMTNPPHVRKVEETFYKSEGWRPIIIESEVVTPGSSIAKAAGELLTKHTGIAESGNTELLKYYTGKLIDDVGTALIRRGFKALGEDEYDEEQLGGFITEQGQELEDVITTRSQLEKGRAGREAETLFRFTYEETIKNLKEVLDLKSNLQATLQNELDTLKSKDEETKLEEADITHNEAQENYYCLMHQCTNLEYDNCEDIYGELDRTKIDKTCWQPLYEKYVISHGDVKGRCFQEYTSFIGQTPFIDEACDYSIDLVGDDSLKHPYDITTDNLLTSDNKDDPCPNTFVQGAKEKLESCLDYYAERAQRLCLDDSNQQQPLARCYQESWEYCDGNIPINCPDCEPAVERAYNFWLTLAHYLNENELQQKIFEAEYGDIATKDKYSYSIADDGTKLREMNQEINKAIQLERGIFEATEILIGLKILEVEGIALQNIKKYLSPDAKTLYNDIIGVGTQVLTADYWNKRVNEYKKHLNESFPEVLNNRRYLKQKRRLILRFYEDKVYKINNTDCKKSGCHVEKIPILLQKKQDAKAGLENIIKPSLKEDILTKTPLTNKEKEKLREKYNLTEAGLKSEIEDVQEWQSLEKEIKILQTANQALNKHFFSKILADANQLVNNQIAASEQKIEETEKFLDIDQEDEEESWLQTQKDNIQGDLKRLKYDFYPDPDNYPNDYYEMSCSGHFDAEKPWKPKDTPK